MQKTLAIEGWGAVTAAGLTVLQTCAAIRAKLSGVTACIPRTPPLEPNLGARIEAAPSLRPTPADWLLSLTTRAIRECLETEKPDPRRVALLALRPEPFRNHPGTRSTDAQFLAHIENLLDLEFSDASQVLRGGAAAIVDGLRTARRLLEQRTVELCLVGGADSLLNPSDLERLGAAGRLYEDDQPQGLIPGEGSGFLLVGLLNRARTFRALGTIAGLAMTTETDSALSERFSTGRALQQALASATAQARIDESAIRFVCANQNSERYAAWEAVHGRARFYRTRRKKLAVLLPAVSIGDTGAASGVLTMIAAGMAMAKGYAPGPVAMCEIASEEGLRGACVLRPPEKGSAYVSPTERARL